MSTRYIVDAEGRPVSAILDIEEFETVLEAHRTIAEAAKTLQEAIRRSSSDDPESQKIIAEATTEIAKVHRALADAERILEDLEDLKAIRAYDEAMAEIERGEDELVPLEEALPRVEAERAELRRRGEL